MLIFLSIIEKEPTELVLQKAYISSHIDRTAVKTNLNSDDRKKIRLFFLFQVATTLTTLQPQNTQLHFILLLQLLQ